MKMKCLRDCYDYPYFYVRGKIYDRDPENLFTKAHFGEKNAELPTKNLPHAGSRQHPGLSDSAVSEDQKSPTAPQSPPDDDEEENDEDDGEDDDDED